MERRCFKLAPGISFRKEDFGGLIFIPGTGEILQVNEAGYNVLESVAEQNQLEKIPATLSFLDALEKKGVVQEING